MKNTGIVRKIDKLGRIVLPIELRKTLDLAINDPVEIYTEEDFIILKKHETACVFCGSTSNVKNHKGKNICSKCFSELKTLK